MSYWSIIPTRVKHSKRLTEDEKGLFYAIADNLNPGGYCTLTNKQLAEILNVSEKTVTTRLASLKTKKYANTLLIPSTHTRRIYLHIPGEVESKPKPSAEEIKDGTKNLVESLKKAIVLESIEPEVLVSRFRQSSYLEKVQDNSTQFILTLDQIEFIHTMRTLKKEIDCQLACYSDVDLNSLITEIRKSKFLLTSKNLNMKWLLENSAKVINGEYRTTPVEEQKKSNFKGRGYSPEELNQCFQNIDDIDF